MKASSPHLRHVALLLALLPGFLLTGGEHLRVCLHGLVGLNDECVDAGAVDSQPQCCARPPDGPSVSSPSSCGVCCIELAGPSTAQSAPIPAERSQLTATCALPPSPTLASTARPLAPPLRLPPPAIAAPPGRAPTPLRI